MFAQAVSWSLTLLGCGSPPAEVDEMQPPAMTQSAPITQPPPMMQPKASHGPYPLVLAHGFSGFRNIGPIDYFYGVEPALTADGRQVWISKVSPYQSSIVRGEQLADYIENVVLPQSGADRVNIIGHSQGGLDARYVAQKLGNKIAAVVTVASPHRGTVVADIAYGDKPGPLTDVLAVILDLFGGSGSDAKAAVRNLTSKGAAEFNAQVSDHPDVTYFSVAGRSSNSLGEGGCQTPTEAAFVAKWDRYRDPVGAELALTASVLTGSGDLPVVNDGLVSVDSARWGSFLGCVPSDHLGEVCQLFGAPRGGGNPFTCVTFYRDLARFLVEHGF